MIRIIISLVLFFATSHTIFASDIETDKIQWHLNRVEWILRQVDTGSLLKEQSDKRTLMLDRLHSYTEAGKFPNNDLFPWKSIPFFRWSNGNLCAVGYLMDGTPENKIFIENIVNTNNNIRIMDAQSNPIINKWANEYGFSILELAMIQPTYNFNCGIKIFGSCFNDLFIIKILGRILIFIWMSSLLISIFYIFRKNTDRAKRFGKYFIITLIAIIILFLYQVLLMYYLMYYF